MTMLLTPHVLSISNHLQPPQLRTRALVCFVVSSLIWSLSEAAEGLLSQHEQPPGAAWSSAVMAVVSVGAQTALNIGVQPVQTASALLHLSRLCFPNSSA